MYPQNRPSQQDPLAVVVLYLSRLDHRCLYSDDQLFRAMNDCYASFGGPDELSLRYVRSLTSGDPEAHTLRERRMWALRVAEDLAGRHPRAHTVPAARRRALFAGVPVVGLYVLIIGSANAGRDFMALPVAGPLNVGLGLGLLQLVVVAACVLWYGRYAETSSGPLPEGSGISVEESGHRR
ncbi:DUF485 domain-containing protein [Streptomyces geranii]|uniref:DUF485 domain-containing protein n=1 Tax=Streptomyces geranii TaxID=2058923 RepID=UPI0018E50089|nr:DUF485 domain-containing protein [Streptomyces geranii]